VFLPFYEDLSGSLSDEGGVAALYLYVKGLPDKRVEGGTRPYHRVSVDVNVDWTEDGEIFGIEILLPVGVLERG
jgi:hypothetical protein